MKMTVTRIAGVLLAFALLSAARAAEQPDLTAQNPPANAMWLEALDLRSMTCDWQEPRAGRSIEGNPLKLAGVTYPHGVGTHANSEMAIDLKGAAVRFVAMVGLDDEKAGSEGSVVFSVLVDKKEVANSGVMRGDGRAKLISVDLTGAKRMVLMVTDAGDGISSDHADWAGAMILLDPAATERPAAAKLPTQAANISMAPDGPEPAIHGPRVVGTTPGRPFVFLIPTTGEGPLTFSARGLPAGLKLDPKTGIITGSAEKEGTSAVQISVRGPRGAAQRKLTIVAGRRKLAQTPPMGWNPWNIWGTGISDERIRTIADMMIKTGLAAHGFQYINLDDGWEAPERDANGEIEANKNFPDMKALGDYIHSKGLKWGIYSSPGPKTCAGYLGSLDHEEQDARTYAKWGIDYLKYDWCSCQNPDPKAPYKIMRAALDKVDRDIVFSLCQYGGANVWEWGASEEIGGNLWRTTGDIGPNYNSMIGIGLSQNGHEKYAGPGHWNDPDMLEVDKLRPVEKVTHMTLWSMLAAPLLIGADLSKLDPVTLAVLTNDEVLDVDQDPLGKQARRFWQQGQLEMWARPLFDGTTAVAFFNRGMDAANATAKWEDLGLKGAQPVRDLWLRKNLGTSNGSFTCEVPPHGAMLVKVGKPKVE